MGDWVVVPCLLALRDEYNSVSPGRDKGADGTIGDTAHAGGGTSDHLPDEDYAALRGKDSDSKNEVHALDIDSSGPWPGGWAWFDAAILEIVERHRTGQDNRLQYVIWNHRIASRSVDNWRWRTYTSTTDPHTDHAHFSSRYTTSQERDTSPWGVLASTMGDDVSFAEKIKITASTAKRLTAYKEGQEVEAGTLLQLAVIGAYDAKNSAEDVAELAASQGQRLAAVEGKLAELLADVDQVDEQTAARIFGGNDAQLEQVLRSALGDARLRQIAQSVLAKPSA